MDGTQCSFIIDEDVLWMSHCCCVLTAVSLHVYVSVEAQRFWVGPETLEKSVLVISAVAPVNSY